MAEYIPAAIAFAIAINAVKEKKPDFMARAKVCNALQDHFGKEHMQSKHYNWCLQYGAEDMMGHFGYDLPPKR
jgi:hypothetical protein